MNFLSRLQQIEKRRKEECVKLTAECNSQLAHYKEECAAKDAELSSVRVSKQISIQVYMLTKYCDHLYFIRHNKCIKNKKDSSFFIVIGV